MKRAIPRWSVEARVARVVAVLASLAFAAFVTVSTSRAAFTATTVNNGNSVSAGTVTLSDDDSGTAMFSISEITPSNTYTKCIVVTYTGTTPTQPVKLYRSGAVTGTGLDQYLDMTVDVGTGGSSTSCTGFTSTSTLYTGTLQSFMGTYLAYGSGLSSGWTPSGSPQSRTFRFSLAVQDTNATQGKNVGFGFTWEAQS